ncbi:hypothetical protein, partial [Nocardia abscessus]|uniref:hypothetical protein n=1 Tax=Nocardia abscessus TaxID=120957 RepID=UPI002454A91F
STAILMATWVATFVLYVFVKPEETSIAPATLVNAVPAAVFTEAPGRPRAPPTSPPPPRGGGGVRRARRGRFP